MGLRSKDIIDSCFAALGYRVEKRRTQREDALPEDPFDTQRDILMRLGTRSPIIFDCGANKGDTAQTYLSMHPSAQVHAFEPFPQCAEQIKDRFPNEPRLTLVEAAVSDTNDGATFHLNEKPATNSLLAEPTDERQHFPSAATTTGTTKVRTLTLDTYTREQNIEHIDILKLDIQGAELMALRGAERLLSEQRVGLIYSEIQFTPLYDGAVTFNELWTHLGERGYTLLDVYHLHRSAGGRLLYGDAIFVSSTIKRDVVDTLAIEG